jgi:hypothetical protein
LLPGSDGRPWLITAGVNSAGAAVANAYVGYRFDPWQNAFVAVDLDLGEPSASSPTRFVSTGPDAFVWLGEDATGPVLQGIRLGNRSVFSNDLDLIAMRDADDAAHPAHLVPDHPPGTSVQYDSLHGVLQLAVAESAATRTCVWISDAEFADFSAQVAFSSSAAPTLELGTQQFSDVNSADVDPNCQLPVLDVSTGGSVLLERSGSHVSLNIDTAHSACDIGSARVPIGVCGSELGPVNVTLISVTR